MEFIFPRPNVANITSNVSPKFFLDVEMLLFKHVYVQEMKLLADPQGGNSLAFNTGVHVPIFLLTPKYYA